MKVSVYEAKSKLSQMINKALEGEEVVITRNGEDTVQLTPVKKKKRDWIGMYKGQIKIHDDFDSLDDETIAYLTGDRETFLDKVLKEDQERQADSEWSILLDTHVFIWAVTDSPRLKPSVRAILSDTDEKVFLSSVTALEVAVKWSVGKLKLPKPPCELINEFLANSGISQLAVTIREACAVGELPFHHKDPFDRLLVAQARANGLRLMTADPILERYDVDVIALWLDEDDE